MGASLATVAQGFIDSDEFSGACGSFDNTGFVTRLYPNILDRMPDAGGLAYHVGLLERGETTRNITLLAFSESAENQALLVGVIGNGVAYMPYLA